MTKLIPHITLQNYLSLIGGDAFVWLHRLIEVFPYNIVKNPVEDEIYYYEGHDFFNSSLPGSDEALSYRMFISLRT